MRRERIRLIAAERELLEETGYRGSRLVALGSFVTNANQGCNTRTCSELMAADSERDPDSGDLEEMELMHFAPEELRTPSRFTEMGVLSYVTLVLLG